MNQINHREFVFEPKIDGWRVARLYRLVANGILAEVKNASRTERAKVMRALLDMPPLDLYERVFKELPEDLKNSCYNGLSGAVFDTIQQFAKLPGPDGRMRPVSALKCLKMAAGLLENSILLHHPATVPLAPVLAQVQQILEFHKQNPKLDLVMVTP